MFILFLFLFGLAIGSFINVLVDRLSHEENIFGRSYCDHCKKQLKAIDLIPVISYLYLKGRCRRCKKKVAIWYPIVELATGIIFVLGWIYIPGTMLVKTLYLGVLASLIAIFFADVKYQIIPDEFQVSLLVFASALGSVNGFRLNFFMAKFIDGFLVMLPLLVLFILTRGRGMGFGDVKLAFVVGFLLRMWGGFIALYWAFVVGAVVGVFLLLARRKKAKSTIAFGPFIVIGVLFMIFFPTTLYTNLFYLMGSYGIGIK